PGNSNHESGLAVDVDDNAAWRSAFEANGFKWLGASDPVHFDYKGPGSIDMDGLSVYAFQRLWNRNHPEDLIAEDKDYGTETEKRLAKSPVGGFPIGAQCNDTPDAGPDTGVVIVPISEAGATEKDGGATVMPVAPGEEGCSMHSVPSSGSRDFAGALCVLGLALAVRVRRRVS
ncbi:MAG: M15 family metallopeptidase, partial [Polyangiaceae bacterium]